MSNKDIAQHLEIEDGWEGPKTYLQNKFQFDQNFPFIIKLLIIDQKQLRYPSATLKTKKWVFKSSFATWLSHTPLILNIWSV